MENNKIQYNEGLEIGSVSVKWIRKAGDTITTKIIRHEGNPKEKIFEIFDQYHVNENNARIVVTGEAAKNLLNLPYISETECFEKCLSYFNQQPDILLSLGGENFILYTIKNGKIKNIISSSKCAAGTGEFIVQQLQRMHLSLEEGIKESYNGKIVPLATRCSVYCKSDATHKLNKGECQPADIARSLIIDLSKKVYKMIDSAQWHHKSILISGGISLNNPFIDSLRSQLKDSEIITLKESPYLEAFGASLFASELNNYEKFNRNNILKHHNIPFNTIRSLKHVEPLLDYRVSSDKNNKIDPHASYILGVDAGSTTTKAILYNTTDDSIGASCYLRTFGNPVLATKACIQELIKQVGNTPIKIIQAAVTGSGREIVSVYLDNCLCFNEILAHAKAAADQVPEVDTVFEIGGQDSKFISFLGGIPVDYAMNEGCSAGTGSFLEESVSVDMHIPVEKISSIAENSVNPISFGERCAAFINTDLRNAFQEGANQDDIIAGLVYSIAKNYISRIVGVRSIGETLLFQGGVALNKSVALAMAAITQRNVVVPPYPELMGCVGAGLMAKELLDEGNAQEKLYNLNDLITGQMEVKNTFQCAACGNKCEIKRISIRDKVLPFGGLCSKYEFSRHHDKNEDIKMGKDFIEMRNKMMFDEYGPQRIENPRGTIGIPMALTAYEIFPFYAKLINELGYNVILSKSSKEGNNKTRGTICYPCEVAHGATYDLLNRGDEADFIFIPQVVELEIPDGHLHSYVCSNTGMIANLLTGAFPGLSDKILFPRIGLSKDLLATTFKQIEEMGSKLGIDKKTSIKAAESALAYYNDFKKKYSEFGIAELANIGNEPSVIIAGKPYSTCSSDINLALPKKIISRGYNVIPADMIPPLESSIHERNAWHFTQQMINSIYYAKNNPNVYICLLSCFSCVPDASIYHLVKDQLAGQTFCYLEIDSHTAHAGFETRVGAFLDIIEEKNRKKLTVA